MFVHQVHQLLVLVLGVEGYFLLPEPLLQICLSNLVQLVVDSELFDVDFFRCSWRRLRFKKKIKFMKFII